MIKQLSNRLLGKDGRWHELLIVGLVAGAVPGYSDMAEPWLLFLVPGWFFYVFLRVYGLLRAPRMDDLAFVLGVGYNARRQASEYFILHKSAELGMVLVVGVVSFFTVRYVTVGIRAVGASAGLALILGGELLIAGGVLWVAFRAGMISPLAHDGSFVIRTEGGSDRIRRYRARLYMRVAGFVASALKGTPRIVLKRQVLLLLRTSVFTTVAVPIIGIVLASAGVVLLRELSPPIMAFAVLLAPAFVLSTQIETMSESAVTARECTYNWFTAGELFRANLVIALLMSAPYPILYAACLVSMQGEPALLLCTRMLSFVCALGVICLVMGVRWSAPNWKGAPLDAALLAIVCVSFGIAVPWYGALISLAAGGVIGVRSVKRESRSENGESRSEKRDTTV